MGGHGNFRIGFANRYFPLQYAPLFENRRTGSITYRKWMVATGEVKARAGDPVIDGAAITEALTRTPIRQPWRQRARI